MWNVMEHCSNHTFLSLQPGLVTMVIVFKSVGLPLEAIGWLFTFDWLLDRCRTVLTMSGDAFGAAIVSKLCKMPDEDEDLDRFAV